MGAVNPAAAGFAVLTGIDAVTTGSGRLEDVLSSVMAFFVAFMVTLGIVAVLLQLTGLDFITSISGAATALANIGPGLGPIIGPAGNFQPLGDLATWILSIAMFIGRLELLVVIVVLSPRFWSS